MKNWYKRMKPKLKNYRWWLTLPVVLVYAFLLTPLVVMEMVSGYVADFFERMNYANQPTPNWLQRLFDWSDGNDKG